MIIYNGDIETIVENNNKMLLIIIIIKCYDNIEIIYIYIFFFKIYINLKNI